MKYEHNDYKDYSVKGHLCREKAVALYRDVIELELYFNYISVFQVVLLQIDEDTYLIAGGDVCYSR